MRILPANLTETHGQHESVCPLRTLSPVQAVEPEGDILHHVEVGKQRIVLEHHADIALLRRHEDPITAQHRVVGDNPTTVHGLESGDASQYRGLSTAARSQQTPDTPFVEPE